MPTNIIRLRMPPAYVGELCWGNAGEVCSRLALYMWQHASNSTHTHSTYYTIQTAHTHTYTHTQHTYNTQTQHTHTHTVHTTAYTHIQLTQAHTVHLICITINRWYDFHLFYYLLSQ